MRKSHVKIGSVYGVKVSGTIQPVRIDRECAFHMIGTNLNSGREVRIRTAARCRFEMEWRDNTWLPLASTVAKGEHILTTGGLGGTPIPLGSEAFNNSTVAKANESSWEKAATKMDTHNAEGERLPTSEVEAAALRSIEGCPIETETDA